MVPDEKSWRSERPERSGLKREQSEERQHVARLADAFIRSNKRASGKLGKLACYQK